MPSLKKARKDLFRGKIKVDCRFWKTF